MVDPRQITHTPVSEQDWLTEVRAAERDGETFRAFDISRRGLRDHPDSIALKHRAVLALARSGATSQARRLFADYGLAGRHESGLRELDARLDKDLALASDNDAQRLELLQAAAAKYEAAYLDGGGYYPGINLANLCLLAGNAERAAAVASRLIDSLRDSVDHAQPEDPFWALATLIEAHLINDDPSSAAALVAAAVAASAGDFTMRATAVRSIRRVADIKGIATDWLTPLTPPTVIHYTGHMIAAPGASGRFPASAEPAVAKEIRTVLEQGRAGFGYGSLASGADILFAEALLERGAQLHVILPFRLEDFIDVSVRPAGAQWVERMQRCLRSAKSVRYATNDANLGDDTLFTYASRIAMGLAVLASQHLFTAVEQVAVWDRTPAQGPAGTAVDVALWRETGRQQRIIGLQRPDQPMIMPTTVGKAASRETPASGSSVQDARGLRPRRARAMLFGDFTRFSAIPDRELHGFFEGVLGSVAGAIEEHRGRMLNINTWGDGLFLVFRRTRDAAACALALQAAMQSMDRGRLGLTEPMALRLGGHLGPVFETADPLLMKPNFFGAHVSLAARIEPITPPGLVYVTETFAAALELEHSDEFCCDYVGLTEAAKGYGTMRMFSLRRRRNSNDGPAHPLAI